jgi:uncharacterized membrane protein
VTETLPLLAALALVVALGELLARRTPLRHLGSALVVILVAALAANLGLLPTYSSEVPLYGVIFGEVAPLSIFWLLLGVRLSEVLRAGRASLVLFGVGAAGTTAGVLLAMALVDGAEVFGEAHRALGGMFVGTYTGGSVNFNAIALEYGVMESATLYAGSAAVDNLMTTLWMATNLLVPRLLGARWPRRAAGSPAAEEPAPGAPAEVSDAERIHPADLAWLLALGAGATVLSRWLAAELGALLGVSLPSILVLTTLALVLAQVPAVARLAGARVLGLVAVNLFLAVIGVLCDLEALRGIGALALPLTGFVATTVLVHGLCVYGAAALLRIDPETASVASQANIGGGTTAMALARSLGRSDLVLPAILMGALGTAAGTYLGFLAAEVLL